MKQLIDRIRREGRHIGGGIIKVDSFLNHQLDPQLTTEIGEEFQRLFASRQITGITKIFTAETSGIAPAFATAQAFGIPCLFARKHRPVTMTEGLYRAKAISRTKGIDTELAVSREYLTADDRVILIDDFLATASTILALINIISQSGARLMGIGSVIEKIFEGGRSQLSGLDVPIISLAKINLVNDEIEVGG